MSFALSGAKAIADRVVEVTLTGAPTASSPYTAGDAYNPASWSITRLDTNTSIVVLSTVRISTTVWDLWTLQSFGPYLATHVVSGSGLTGISNPATWNFSGLVPVGLSTVELQTARVGTATTDLQNVQAPTSTSNGVGLPGGTLTIDSSGDYVTQTGEGFVRKMITRIVTTPTGAFFHLPDFGAATAVKSSSSIAALSARKSSIQRQVAALPEVEDCSVSLSFTNATGELDIVVLARLRATGQTLSVGVSKVRF